MKWLIDKFDGFLRDIHYICDFEHWWVRPWEEGYAEYKKAYEKQFGKKKDFEKFPGGEMATFRELWRCKKCGRVEGTSNTGFI